MRYVCTLWGVHFSAFCNVSFEVYLHLSLYLYLYFIRNENYSVAPRFLEDMSRPSRPLQQPVGVAMPVVPPPRPVGPPPMHYGASNEIKEIEVCKKCPKVEPYFVPIFDPIVVKPCLDDAK